VAIATSALVLLAGGGATVFVLTDAERTGETVTRLMAESAELREGLAPTLAQIERKSITAETALEGPSSDVLNGSDQAALVEAIQNATTAQSAIERALGASPRALTTAANFRWPWASSTVVTGINGDIRTLENVTDQARSSLSALDSAIKGARSASTTWASELETTLIENAAQITVKGSIAYDGTEPSLVALLALLDSGGQHIVTHEGSTAPVVTAHNFNDPTALTLAVGDVVSFHGDITGIYDVVSLTNIDPWTVPNLSENSDPETKSVGLQALTWDGTQSRHVTLKPHAAAATNGEPRTS
jgi:hypothetical protein